MYQCLVVVHQDAHSFSSHLVLENIFVIIYFAYWENIAIKEFFYSGKNIITSQ